MAQEYTINEKTLTCPVCAGTLFTRGHSLLSSRAALFFGMDWTSPNADTYTCAQCACILWFAPSIENTSGSSYYILEQQMHCPICQRAEFTMIRSTLSTKNAVFFHVDWSNPQADNYICIYCGFIQWILTSEIDNADTNTYSILDHTLTCPTCGNTQFLQRQTLLSTRLGEMAGVDWLNPNADNFICTRCGTIQWFEQR